VRALKRVSTRDVVLRRARTSLGRQLTLARAIYGQGKRFCSPVEAVGGHGLERGGAPRGRAPPGRARAPGRPAGAHGRAAAAAQRGRGSGGELASSVLQDGIDPRDPRTTRRGDPVAGLLRQR
jgi:hypothetical protein